MSQFPYIFFEECVVRTPLFSRKEFQEMVDREEISDALLKNICQNPIFQEALYLASPYLYSECEKWLSGKEMSVKEAQKLKNTLLKYYSRMSTRCTPFGLFAGVGMGSFHDIPNNPYSYSGKVRDTKLDMHFLVGLSTHLINTPEIKEKLLFFPNNSMYKVGRKIRYIEYEYTAGKRDYIISSAPLSKELQEVLYFSKHGKTSVQIAEMLTNNEVSQEEAKEFIEELIDNQALISELEPNVSGNNFLDTLISVLDRLQLETESISLKAIKIKLDDLDRNIGNPASLYSKIEDLIKSLKIDYEQKYLFQTDVYNKEIFTLPSQWKKEVKKVLSLLNKITVPVKNSHLSVFKKAFYERFESEEVPLTLALDTEIGIGYRQNSTAKGIHPYLEHLDLPASRHNQDFIIRLTPAQKILNEKLQEAQEENSFVIQLSDEDFKEFEVNWDDLPDTVSFMAEIVSENTLEKLYVNGGGGSSAANLLGRFCSEKSEVQNLTKAIAKKEEELNPDCILAEIIHLPEARIGNIIRRPELRQFEIPYLAQSALPEENQIPVDDLYISLRNDRLVLRSKKLNKEVKPYLTNAHNYYANSLPVYHFLSDLHSQNKRTGLYFDWGDMSTIYNFLPRVEYKNSILSKASWKVTEKEIKSFSSLEDKKPLLDAVKSWRTKRKIPKWIQWVQSDNKLTINLDNNDQVKIFLDAVIKFKSISIEEFLFNENDAFMHEFVFPMYREQ